MKAPTTTKTQTHKQSIFFSLCLRVFVVIVLCRCLFPPTTAKAVHIGTADGSFEPEPCAFENVPADDPLVECGYLTVPERHDDPNGKTIQLAVVIFRATGSRTVSDPFVMAQGGPGGSTISTYANIIQTGDLARLRQERDVILFDQRGTLNSRPALGCPELTTLTEETIEQQLSYEEGTRLGLDALFRCRDRLTREGVNFAAFNSLENAADVASLRAALGYAEVNLYGVSYGTLLALHTLRDYPDALRSVIIDAVVPTQTNFVEGSGRSFDRALTELFRTCATTPDCNAAYPNLEQVFWQLVDEFNRNPPRVLITDPDTSRTYNAVLDGETFYGLVFQFLYVTQALPVLPKIIYDARDGRFDVLARIWPLLAFDRDTAIGMYYSVVCAEDADFQPGTNTDDIRPQIAEREQRDNRQIIQTCARWNVPGLGPAVDEPVVSDIPTLIFNGQFDPITPPAYGQEAARTLSRSYIFTFPANGHGALSDDSCATNLTLAFLDNPQVSPDESCVANQKSPDFISPEDTAFTPAIGRILSTFEGGSSITLLLLIGSALVLLLVFIGWPLSWVVQRVRKQSPERRRLARLALWLVLLLTFIAWTLIIGLTIVVVQTSLAGGDLQLLLGVPRSAAWLLWLSPIIAVLSVGMVMLAALAWIQSFWGVGRRIFYTLLALAALGLTTGLYQTGLLG